MNWTEYQTAAQRTADTEQADDIRRQLCALGLIGETGEVAELLKHALSHGEDVDIDRLKLELGDVCWYAAEACSISGDVRPEGQPKARSGIVGLASAAAAVAYTLDDCNGAATGNYRLWHLIDYVECIAMRHGIAFADVLAANIAKLHKRHPDGFTVEASINRGTT